ncbi:MAG: TIGR03013 family PEP-CTERM/XrtA system glycosyltransferase [Desulfobacterales bacterium]|nr:MAG: TIGR03013 family PEP-CTERM/XrtA system glycosyltransferase [Desulfobacterales bacterium]
MLRVFRQYYPVRNIFFVVGEGLFIFLSFFLASLILLGSESFVFDLWLFLKILFVTGVCQASLYYNDLYDLKITDSFKELGIRLLQALGIAAIVLAFVFVIFPQANIGRGIFVVSIGFIIVLVLSWRYCYSLVLTHGIFDQKIILLGSGELAKNIKDEINSKKDCGYTLSVMVPECANDIDFTEQNNPAVICKKNYEGLCELAKALGIQKIVVGFREKRHAFPTKELLKCRVEGIDVVDGNSFYEMLTGKLRVEDINPSWLIFSDGFQKSGMRRFLKRSIDLILSFLLLLSLSPVILLTTVLIKIDSKGSVFFSQERVGEKGRIYRIHKFRSMVADAEKISGPVWAQDNDGRVTRVGRIIRRLRIDEIPQLWNVLKGEMSFVGPRPEREFFVRQLEEKIPYYGERCSVKPGITGWAQVSYGYGASVEDAIEKLNYDLFYIKNMTTFMDLMIVLRTIKIVLFGKGVR